ncbi:hypothetical protein DESC_260128 [Desulfosarcina cetonica]|nr:hypothetical protein DESC_260128 [Desulfosarcina cetonica]
MEMEGEWQIYRPLSGCYAGGGEAQRSHGGDATLAMEKGPEGPGDGSHRWFFRWLQNP